MTQRSQSQTVRLALWPPWPSPVPSVTKMILGQWVEFSGWAPTTPFERVE
jgi:hypothetical protein